MLIDMGKKHRDRKKKAREKRVKKKLADRRDKIREEARVEKFLDKLRYDQRERGITIRNKDKDKGE